MRVVRQDITGTTDANGNATIKVPLPFTGAWYDVKFPLSISNPAEWAILVSGTPVTYGRGRRVTLGPELIQDGETVTINVTGGPPSAAIIGSMNGKAGYAEEMLAAYSMSPNTIALDTATPEIVIGTLNAAQALAAVQDLPLPPGTQAVGFVVNLNSPNVVPGQILIQGNTTKQFYVQAATFPSGQGVQTALVSISETSVRCSVSAPAGGPSSATFLAFLTIPPPTSLIALPAPWQAARGSIGLSSQPGALNTDFTIVSGIAGQIIYVHDVVVNTNAGQTWEVDLWDGPSANGVNVAKLTQNINGPLSAGSVSPYVEWDGHGRPLTPSDALVGTIVSGPAGTTVVGTYGFSRG